MRRTERRPSTEVALDGAGAATGRGVLIGVALFGAVRILAKLHLRDRVQAVVYAYRHGLVT